MSIFHTRLLRCLLLSVGACGLTAGCYWQVEAQEGARTAEGQVVESIRIESQGGIDFFTISPDGKALAYKEVVALPEKKWRSELVLLDLTTGKELRRRQGSFNMAGVFSPDGQLLAVGSSKNKVAVWDVKHWEPKLELEIPDKHRDGIPLAFSPDKKFLVGSSFLSEEKLKHLSEESHWVILWDLSTGQYRLLGLEEKPQKETLQPKLPPGVFDPLKVVAGAEAQAVTFAEDGSPFFFAEHGPGAQTAVWGIAQGQPLQSLWGGRWWYRGCRTTPGGRTLVLPKYNQLPIMAARYQDSNFRDDGSISVVAALSGQPCRVLHFYAGLPFKELWRFKDFKDSQSPTRFPSRFRLTPDGKKLVAVGIRHENVKKEQYTSTLLVWDVSKLHAEAAKQAKEPSREERERWWADLFKEHPHPEASETIYLAHRAMFSLVANPKEAVPYLREHLGPPSDVKRIPKLIEDLDSEDFKTREQASRELAGLGQAAVPLLEKALAKKPSVEARRRLEALLDKARANAVGDELRMMRVIDVLEHINTAEARELLRTVAEGGYGPVFADEAKKALQRLAKKP